MPPKEKPTKGEVIIVPSKKALEPEFWQALKDFQYGDPRASDEGFERMRELAISKRKKPQ